MRVAIVSDIHSNLPALEAVLRELDRLRPEKILCAGDIVGYNASPDDVCGMLKDRQAMLIAGNHDRAACSGDFSDMNRDAAVAAAWTRRRLSDGSRRFLCGIPPRRALDCGGRRILMVHGSPQDDDEYVFPLGEGQWPFGNPGADILVMGHTHVPWTDRFPKYRLTVVNPGSVGQPRDGNPQASFAILDTKKVAVDFHRTKYDVGRAARAVIAAGLPPGLADRLYTGH